MAAVYKVGSSPRHAWGTMRRIFSTVATWGVLLFACLLWSANAEAQNINDILRILIPPAQQQRPPPVYNPPPTYSPPPRYSPPPAYQPPPRSQVSRAQVQHVQKMLNDLGYDAGPVDGVAGRRTIEALNAFQRDNGLAATTAVDKQGLATLTAIHRHAAANTPERTELSATAGSLSDMGAPASPSSLQADASGTSFVEAMPSASGSARATAEPAFDCSRAGTPTEITLCTNPALATLDVQLADLYKQQLAAPHSQGKQLQQAQRNWLASRNQCGDDASCLFNAYSERIAHLSDARQAQLATASPAAQANTVSSVMPNPHPTSVTPGAAVARTHAAVATPGTDLRTLEAPTELLKPLIFEYHDGIPILTKEASQHLFTLMGFATKDPSSLELHEECAALRSLLSEGAQKRLLQGVMHDCWKGTNEFERADARNAFYAQHFDTIKASAPRPPFRFAFIGKNTLQAYDADKGEFSLYLPVGALFSARFEPTQYISTVSHGTNWPPSQLKMDEAAARALLDKVASWPQKERAWDKEPRTGTRIVTTFALVDVLHIDWEASRVDIRLVSAGLYDPGLKEKVYEFAVGAPYDSLIRGQIPERFNIPSPVPLNEIYAFVRTFDDDMRAGKDTMWQRFFTTMVKRDQHFYTSLTTTPMPEDDVRLPVLPRTPPFRPVYQAHLEKWAQAYRAGLPDEVVRTVSRRDNRTTDPNGFSVHAISDRMVLPGTYTALLEAEGIAPEHTTLLNFDNVPFLVVTPSPFSFYSLHIPRAAIKGLLTDPITTTAVFRTGTLKPVTVDGRRVFILPLTPLSLTASKQGTVLATREFLDTAQLENTVTDAQSTAPTNITLNEPLEMSPVLLELIMLKALSDQLPNETIRQMAARRWKYESIDKTPLGGRFFASGAHQPTSADLAKLNDKFRTWGSSRLPDGPLRLRLAGQSTNVGWSGFECAGSIPQLRAYPDHLSYIKDVSPQRKAVLEHNVAAGQPLRKAYSGLQHKFGTARTGRSNWSPEEDYELALLKVALAVQNTYHPIGEHCQLLDSDASDSGLVSPYLYIDHPRPASTRNSTVHYYVATLEVTGVRLADGEPHYSDLLPASLTQQYQLTPPQRAPGQAAIIETKLIDVAYFNPVNNAELERYPADETRSIKDLVASMPVELAEPASQKPDGPYGFEIVGLQIGMSMDEAEKVIRQHMDVGRVLESARTDDSGPLVPLTSGKLFVSKDEMEYIAIMDEPPAITGKVVAAWRRLYMPPDTMMIEDALAALREKYDDPSPQEPVKEGINRWRTMAGNECDDIARGRDALIAPWTENGAPVQLQITEPHMPGHYRNPLQEYGRTDCGPMMIAYVNFDASRQARRGRTHEDSRDYIEQSISDVGPYVEAFKANREARIRGTDTSDGKPTRPKL